VRRTRRAMRASSPQKRQKPFVYRPDGIRGYRVSLWATGKRLRPGKEEARCRMAKRVVPDFLLRGAGRTARAELTYPDRFVRLRAALHEALTGCMVSNVPWDAPQRPSRVRTWPILPSLAGTTAPSAAYGELHLCARPSDRTRGSTYGTRRCSPASGTWLASGIRTPVRPVSQIRADLTRNLPNSLTCGPSSLVGRRVAGRGWPYRIDGGWRSNESFAPRRHERQIISPVNLATARRLHWAPVV